jgi:hypothetical protein
MISNITTADLHQKQLKHEQQHYIFMSHGPPRPRWNLEIWRKRGTYIWEVIVCALHRTGQYRRTSLQDNPSHAPFHPRIPRGWLSSARVENFKHRFVTRTSAKCFWRGSVLVRYPAAAEKCTKTQSRQMPPRSIWNTLMHTYRKSLYITQHHYE